MTNDNYTKITWPEVRKGDVLLHENGDRLTVSAVGGHSGDVHVSGVWRMVEALRRYGFSPYRRKPEMPTVPGAYHDKYGNACILDGEDGLWISGGLATWVTAEDVEHRAPFTRLVPMPTEDQVHATVYNALRGSAVEGMYPLRTINAVMALLTGKEADDA